MYCKNRKLQPQSIRNLYIYNRVIEKTPRMKLNSSILSLTIILIYLLSMPANAQQDPPRFIDKVSFGGNLGANFGNNFTSIIVAPQAIYRVDEHVGIGLGLNYSYSRLDTGNPNILDFKSTVLGGGIIGLFNPSDFLQISMDFEMLNVNRNFDNPRLDDTYWLPVLFLGAGYRQGNFVIGARYDVLYDANRSIYNNGIQPFVRVMF
jgi:hypothetical protein